MRYISEMADGDETNKVSTTKAFSYYVTSDGRCYRLPATMSSGQVARLLKKAMKGEQSEAMEMGLYIIHGKPYVWLGCMKRCLASLVIGSFTNLGDVKPDHILFIDGDVTNCSVENLAVTDGKASLRGLSTTITTKSGQSVMFTSSQSAAIAFGYSKSYVTKIASQPTDCRSSVIDTVTREKRDA